MNKLLAILKNIGIVVGTLTAVGGVFVYLDGIKDDVADTQDMVADVWTEVVVQQGAIQEIKDTVGRLEGKLDYVTVRQKKQDENIDQLGWYLRNQRNFDPDQLELLLDEWFKKKDLTVLHGPD